LTELPAHVHCGECRREIAVQEEAADGRIIDVALVLGTQFVLVQVGPGQLEPKRIPVPLCTGCAEKLKNQSIPAPPKLIVPQGPMIS